MSGGPKVPKGYQPTGQPQADQSYQQIIQSQMPWATGLPNFVIPQAQQLTSNIVNNPYAQQYQQGINRASNIATNQVGPMDLRNSQIMSGLLGPGQQMASGIYNAAFDPQQALYNRTAQQLMDQSNVINSMYGLSSSPYGAGVADQAMSNFNIDWQNNQLQRMLMGSQGYGNVVNAMSGAGSSADTLGSAGLTALSSGATAPWQTANNISGAGLDALGGFNSLVGGALQPGGGISQELATYLGLGQSATQNAQRGTALQSELGQQQWGGFGNLLGGLFNAASNPLSLFGQTIW